MVSHDCTLFSMSVLIACTILLNWKCLSVSSSTVQLQSSSSISSTSHKEHENQLEKILSDIRARSPEKKITLKRKPEQSHCPRPHNYKTSSIQLDISKFDKLLGIEYLQQKRQLISKIPRQLRSRVTSEEIFAVADVQALMSMEQLVRESSI
jgi:hypothetical protein